MTTHLPFGIEPCDPPPPRRRGHQGGDRENQGRSSFLRDLVIANPGSWYRYKATSVSESGNSNRLNKIPGFTSVLRTVPNPDCEHSDFYVYGHYEELTE